MISRNKKRIGPRVVNFVGIRNVLDLCIAHRTVARMLEVDRYANNERVSQLHTYITGRAVRVEPKYGNGPTSIF